MAAAALLIRLVVMSFSYSNQLDPARDHWAFGFETGRVARSIASGQGFSSPYPEPTGPTALIPPVYVYLVAGVFKLFGIYSPASALVMLILNNLISAMTCLPVFFIARRIFGLRTAIWAGWIWALFPYAAALANSTVWETALSTLLLSLVVLATLRLESSTSWKAWVGYGALCGLAVLTNPAILSALPFLGAWLWLRHRRRGENPAGAVATASLVFLCATVPWIWRCSQTYGRFVALRGGAGLEALVGNSNDTSHPANFKVIPENDPVEMESVKTLGEPAYMAEKEHEAAELVARSPLRYLGLTLRRVLYTWTGLWEFPPRWKLDEEGLPNALTYSFISLVAFLGLYRAIRDRRDVLIPLVIPLALFPIPYYLTHSEARYRHPIDPLIVVLAASGAVILWGWISAFLERRAARAR